MRRYTCKQKYCCSLFEKNCTVRDPGPHDTWYSGISPGPRFQNLSGGPLGDGPSVGDRPEGLTVNMLMQTRSNANLAGADSNSRGLEYRCTSRGLKYRLDSILQHGFHTTAGEEAEG